MRVRLAVSVLLVALAAPLGAQKAAPPPTAKNALGAVKKFVCSFPAFSAVRFGASPPQVIPGTQDFSFAIDSIDYKKGRAQMTGNATTLLTMLLSTTGMTLIEQTPIGNVNITTIFAGGGNGKTFMAVHSRHLGELDAAPHPSQAYGNCQISE